MYWNRFDIVAAYALFLEHFHEGQFSRKYQRLSKIRTYYKVGGNRSYLDEVMSSENAKEIYDRLVEKEYQNSHYELKRKYGDHLGAKLV